MLKKKKGGMQRGGKQTQRKLLPYMRKRWKKTRSILLQKT
jgi:hypothetical protein